MLLLRSIDFERSLAELSVSSASIPEADMPAVERLLHVARALGLREIQLRDRRGRARSFQVENPIAATPASSDAATAVATSALPRVEVVQKRIDADVAAEYVVRQPHAPGSLRPVSSFVALALATHLQSNSELLKVRLGLYEILVNVLEHGRPLRPGAALEVALVLEPGAVRGWIRDECSCFDPRQWPSVPVADLVSGRSTRGYGIHLVRQILGTLEHEFDGNGNTLTFRKEISPVTTADEQVLFSSETFKVVRRSDTPDTGVRIALAGHLDVDSAPVMVEILRGILKQGTHRIELDVRDVPFISSLGIGSLIALIGEARESGGDIELHAVSDDLRSAFEMLDLLDFVTIS